jgi:raffinose/stachyose/melibiose transport system permease protein
MTGRITRRAVLYIVLTILAVSILFPLLWMFVTSFRDNSSALVTPFSLGGTWSFKNYEQLFAAGSLVQWLTSSVIVNVFSVVLIAFLASFAAYGFSTFKFRGKNVLFALVIVGLTIPPQALVIAGFRWISLLDLQNSYLGLIFTYGGWTSFGILMLRNFFDSVPKELREAALMDGASHFRTFWQIFLPLARSPLLTVVIFSAIWVWNDFVYPLVYIQSDSMYTIPIGVLEFTGRTTTQIATQMAVLTFATALPLLVYLACRKQFMRGLLEGAVKG